jgi:phosphate ABC transporter phosphate-binding protein
MDALFRRSAPLMSSSLKFAASRCALLLLLLSTTAIAVQAQVGERLSQVKRIYVDSLGTGNGATEMRDQLIERLRKTHKVQVVSDSKDADALIRGTGRTWVTGHVSLSPRSHSAIQPTFEGFLSVELVGKNDETLWSYLVSPSRFPWNGIADDLAHQMVSKLLVALKVKDLQESAPLPAQAQVAGTLRGAGATFPAPLYQRWFELFQEIYPGVRIRYETIGSAEGIQRLKEGKLDFAGTEMPLSDEAMSESHQPFLHLPAVLGAVVAIYNVNGLRQDLNFTPEILSGIFLGKITKWNDPQIRKSNRGASLPDAEIVVVHRSDGSGTSFVWTDYLSKVSPEWRTSVGAGATVRWPVGIGAERNEGVASTVKQTPNSIAYVEFIYAIQHELSFGAVRNAARQFVKANISSITAAATTGVPSRDFRVSITNPPDKTAYPIATYTWLLVPEHVEDANQKNLLAELLRWMLTEGQKKCSALGYAPLPAEVAKRALESFDPTK